MKTCFFIGHRETPDAVLSSLMAEVERHIVEYGVTDFVVGRYGNFDMMAARAVLAAKKRHPAVALTILLPYHPAERPISIPEGCEGSVYPPDLEKVPRRLAILRANHWMLCQSDFLIAWVSHPSNGAREVLREALDRQKRGMIKVTNLAGWDPA